MNTSNSKLTEINENPDENVFEKIMNLNKLGSLFLSSDKYDKAISILSKTLEFYKIKKENKEIPNFFYNNLYCNLAKAYSCNKQFKEAELLYKECITNHPLYKILYKNNDFLKEKFLLDINNIINVEIGINLEELKKKFEIIFNFFDLDGNDLNNSFNTIIFSRFKSNNLSSLSSFTDSLVNLAVIFQYHNEGKMTTTPFNMYYLAILCEPNNNVANINFNNNLRELNLKELSDEYMIKRIKNSYKSEIQEDCENSEISIIKANQGVYSVKCQSISFVCMKWGSKYGADYVNKLYNGIKRNISSTNKFIFYCISDNFEGLNHDIKKIELNTNFKGWMKKSVLFLNENLELFTSNNNDLICFIDLDMIICGSLDYLFGYEGNFCVLKTDDIKCEKSLNGYNSSIILWRNGFGKEIYEYMEKYGKWINNQVIRFDQYLEFIVKNSDFMQDLFKGQILDYNTYCKYKEYLPDGSSIIAFPRTPKPHECHEKWISEFWI